MFAGRERELAELAGRAGRRITAGPRGGRRRHRQDAVRDRGPAGQARSVWGACLPLAEKLPFLPVTEALDALSRIEDGALLAGALAAIPPYAQAEAVRLLPSCAGREAPAVGPGGAGSASGCSPVWPSCWPRPRAPAGSPS